MDTITHVFYINLEHRTDRRVHVEQQLRNIGINNAQRFNAIKMENGAIGCSMSHLQCLEIALANDWDHVMIVEDDILFLDTNVFLIQFSKCISRNDFDVLLLGGNNKPPYARIDDSCIQVKSCYTTTGYIVKKHYYNTLIANIRESIKKLTAEPSKPNLYAIDVYWAHLQRQGKWLLITPLTVVQMEGYSDIDKRMTSYISLMTEIEKPVSRKTNTYTFLNI
jgi:glycosyl transferase family 25